MSNSDAVAAKPVMLSGRTYAYIPAHFTSHRTRAVTQTISQHFASPILENMFLSYLRKYFSPQVDNLPQIVHLLQPTSLTRRL